MASERFWRKTVQLFTVDGSSNGIVTVDDVSGFKVKAEVIIQSSVLSPLTLEIKNIPNATTIEVGPKSASMDERSDLSAYLAADGATVSQLRQRRPSIGPGEIDRATYEEEPTVARRVILVDEIGNKITQDNPLPTTATLSGDISIGTDGFSLTSPDSMLTTGSEDGTRTGIKHAIRVDSELDLRIGISDGNNKATVNPTGELSVSASALDVAISTRASEATLQALAADINTLNLKFNTLGQKDADNSVPVVLASDQPAIPVNATIVGSGVISVDLDAFSVTPDNVMTVGTLDGTKTGTKFGFVNNIRQQILAAHDRTQILSYADFGTKNQRVYQIDYQSATFPGVTARKVITYTPIGNRYRRDSINWILV